MVLDIEFLFPSKRKCIRDLYVSYVTCFYPFLAQMLEDKRSDVWSYEVRTSKSKVITFSIDDEVVELK